MDYTNNDYLQQIQGTQEHSHESNYHKLTTMKCGDEGHFILLSKLVLFFTEETPVCVVYQCQDAWPDGAVSEK